MPSSTVESSNSPSNDIEAIPKGTSDIENVDIKSLSHLDDIRLKIAVGQDEQLERNYGLFSLTALGIIIAKYGAWAATAGTIVTALPNGGPMAILYGLVLVGVFYTLISASLAELASAIPSAGGVYHWSSVLSKRYGKSFGLFAGYLNACGWLLSAASISSILANEAVAMYLLRHPTVEWHPYQVFIAYQLCNWTCCAIVCTCNRWLPLINQISFYITMLGLFISILTLALMPRGRHASSTDVWVTFSNNTGGWSNGLCFMTGLLNAAFAVGVPDCQSHLAEEVRDPQKTVPKGMMLQILTAFSTAFVYLIALFYSMSSLDDVLMAPIPYFPTATIYLQATRSSSATIGLISILFIATFPTLIGTFVTGGRMWWALARADATPFGPWFARISTSQVAPVRTTIAISGFVTVLGCVYLGSTTAFQALISSFVVLSTLSYGGAILPHVLTGRRNIAPGPFYMGHRLGMAVNIAALAYIAVTCVFFCFPFVLPVTPRNMNYTTVIGVGLMAIVSVWWFFGVRKDYQGPKYSMRAAEMLARKEKEIEEANRARDSA
ncbi:MAG: hypothetical protein M1814_005826 [Vezdaea aestivalis]|nr:MAG: hypothetical protein M1814_005826 [Vezdaea aestivalis]